MNFLRITLAGLLAVSVAVVASAADLATLDGKKLSGDIVSVVDNELTFKTAAGEEKFLVTALHSITLGPAPKALPTGTRHTVVELTDGSVFRCESITVKEKTIEMKLLGSVPRTISVPTKTVFSVNREAGDLKLEQDFRNEVRRRGRFDVWVTKQKGKNDQGTEIDRLDGVPGTFGPGDADGQSVEFIIQATGAKSNLRMTQVSGMIFNQQPEPGVVVPPAMCKVIDSDGHELVAQSVGKAAKGYSVTTVTGVKFDLDANQVSKFDFAAGAVKYLSDLEPIALEESGTNPEHYQKDKNLDKQPIRLVTEPGTAKAPEMFPKGLTLKAKTVITYELKGQYKTFRAIAGVDVDPQNEAPSQVRLTIDDGMQVLYKGVIKKGEKPVDLNLSVQNVDKLKITAESDASSSDFGNQVSLGNARVVK